MDKCLCYQPTDRYTVQQMLDHPWTQSDQKLSQEKLESTMRGLFKTAMEAKAKDPKKMDKLDGASKLIEKKVRDIEEFGELPLWEHRALPRGRTFALKRVDGVDEKTATREFLEFLEKLTMSQKGAVDFKPEELKITLKLKFEVEHPVIETIEKEETAHVNIFKLADEDTIFALFDFPKHFHQHEHEQDLYDLYAGDALPEWMDDKLTDEQKEALHLAAIEDLQSNDGTPSDGLKNMAMNDYGATEAEFEELVAATATTPIEFQLPTLTDWLIPRCLQYLDPLAELDVRDAFSVSDSGENYDDMADFFAAFNEEDPMGDFFKEAANQDRMPTMETHGYVLQEE